MQTGRPSRTALRVAARRAAHQLLDPPPVLADPIAVRILGPDFALDRVTEAKPISRSFRAFMAARSRYAEDNLATAVSSGVTQFVVLGAGLDTFAWRNPFPNLRVFEVDFPATQAWKRELLAAANLPEPTNLTFVPLDFEHQTLTGGLTQSGLDFTQRAFFSWLGVVPYLTLPAFRSTLDLIASLPTGSGLSFDFALSDAELSPLLQLARKALAERVAAAGEPFKLFFRSGQLENELRSSGFSQTEQLDSIDINQRYFHHRADGLALPPAGLGKLATAWV